MFTYAGESIWQYYLFFVQHIAFWGTSAAYSLPPFLWLIGLMAGGIPFVHPFSWQFILTFFVWGGVTAIHWFYIPGLITFY